MKYISKLLFLLPFLLISCTEGKMDGLPDDANDAFTLCLHTDNTGTRATDAGLPGERIIRNYVIYFYLKNNEAAGAAFYMSVKGIEIENRISLQLTREMLLFGGVTGTTGSTVTKGTGINLTKDYLILVVANYPSPGNSITPSGQITYNAPSAITGISLERSDLGTQYMFGPKSGAWSGVQHSILPPNRRAADGSDIIFTGVGEYDFSEKGIHGAVNIPLIRNVARIDIILRNQTDPTWQLKDVTIVNEQQTTPLFSKDQGNCFDYNLQSVFLKRDAAKSIANYRTNTDDDGEYTYRYYCAENLPSPSDDFNSVFLIVTRAKEVGGDNVERRDTIYPNEEGYRQLKRNYIYKVEKDF